MNSVSKLFFWFGVVLYAIFSDLSSLCLSRSLSGISGYLRNLSFILVHSGASVGRSCYESASFHNTEICFTVR